MAKCSVCGKGPAFGHHVSHANNRSRKIWRANIKSVRVAAGGSARRIRVCTRCLKSGRVARTA